MSIILDSIKACFNLKQKDKENLQEYTRRFKTSTEIMESHIGGSIQLIKYVKTMDGFDINDVNKTKELNKAGVEQLFAFTYLKNSDQHRYGSILKDLNKQKSLGNDQYHKTITETNNVPSNHRFDNPKRNNNRRIPRNKKKKSQL